MKTAIETLINEIEQSQKRFIDLAKTDKKLKKGVDSILTATTLIKMKAKELLETEKQQIIDAYSTCCNCEGTPFDGEQYYNETFETNKETFK